MSSNKNNDSTKFPVAIISFAAHPIVGGVERVSASHARSIARLGYPVRLIVGQGGVDNAEYILRRVSLLDPLNPRIVKITDALNEGTKPDDFEECVIDTATALGRELVGVGTVFLHDIMTSPLNLVAAEAIKRLEFGSRGKKAPGTPERVWVNWVHNVREPDAPCRSYTKKGAPWSVLKTPLANAKHIAPSSFIAGELAKAQKIAKTKIKIIPSGIDCARELELTPKITELVDGNNLFDSKGIIFTPARMMPNKNLTETLDVFKALKGYTWILTGAPDAHSNSPELTKEFLGKRAKLSLEDNVILLGAEVTEEDRRALMRLSDCVLLPSDYEGLGLPVMEAAIGQKLIALGGAKAPSDFLAKQKSVVKRTKTDTAKTFAKKLKTAIEGMPLYATRREIFSKINEAAVAKEYLIPLITTKKAGAK